MPHAHRPPRPARRHAWPLAGLLLALLACSAEPEPVRRHPRREVPGALRAEPPAPSAEALRIEACVERGAHGPGYDELAPRDARRKLRRLQLRAECEAQPRP